MPAVSAPRRPWYITRLMVRLLFHSLSLTVALLLAFLCLQAPAQAASGRELLQKAREHYDFAEFEQAEQLLTQALRTTGLSADQKAEVYTHLGLIALARGDQPGAEQAFAQARQAAPGYRPGPGVLPPKAEALFNQAAPPSPAPSPTPAPRPSPAPRPARGYVLSLGPDGILLDLGSKQGVQKGDQFAVIDVTELVHPVSKAKFTRRRQVALLRVVEVEPEISLAKMVQGKVEVLKPGQGLQKQAAASQPAPAPAAKPAPAAAVLTAPHSAQRSKLLRVAVLPPAMELRGSLQGMEPSEIPTAAVAKALNVLRPLQALVPSDQEAEALLKASGASLQELMKRMDLDMVLSWGVSQQEYEERATVFCLLTRRDNVQDQLYEYLLVNDFEFRKKFAKLITRLMAKALGYI